MVVWGEGNHGGNNSHEVVEYGVFAKNIAKFSDVETSENLDDALFLGSDGSFLSRTFSFQAIVDKLKTIFSGKSHSHGWDAITGKPSSFTPSSHSHDWASITGKPSSFTPSSHSHDWASITGKPSSFLPSSHNHSWDAITSKPSSFPPSSHSHDWASITGKPSSFTPSSHDHSWDAITDKPSTYTPSSHNHSWTSITGRPSTFTPSAHNHTWSQITGAPAGCNVGRPGGGARSVILNDPGSLVDSGIWDPSADYDYSASQGYRNKAGNFAAMAVGKFCKGIADGGTKENTTGDAFVVGGGFCTSGSLNLSNAFRVTYAGAVYGVGSFKTSGADYAEFFEWLDANVDNEDRVGRFVAMEGGKIKLAQPGDYILGIVSGNPCIVGNADEDWLGRWQHDDFGRFIKEYLEEVEQEVQPPEGLDEEALHRWMSENRVKERDGAYIQTVSVVVDHETPSWRYKANPDYDPNQPYIERKDRQEWDYVGMLGVLAVLDDGTCQVNGFAQVAQDGTATAAEGYIPGMTYRVIERVAENIVKVVFR